MTDPIEPVTWWSPAGFSKAMPASAFANVLSDEQDWYAALGDAGYDRAYATANEYLEASFEVWSNRDGHLYVSINDRTSFLIDREHRTAFWVTLFPTLQAAELAVRHTEAVELQTKTLLAWVRHGHGTSTISDTGFTRDEDLRWQAEQRRKAASKPKA